MDDIEAGMALKNGSEQAFKLLFKKHYAPLVAYITTFTNDSVKSEDIVQQAFINLWNERTKLNTDKSPKAYLYAIAYNRYIDTVKNTKRYEKLLDNVKERALREQIKENEEKTEKKILKLRRVIETLPPKCRQIIYMNKVQGIKYKEIAVQLDISVKTVEAQMRIAFKKVREAFKKEKLLLFFNFRKKVLKLPF